MTIIVATRTMMVADGLNVHGPHRGLAASKKIVRCQDGSLCAATGMVADCRTFTGLVGTYGIRAFKPSDKDGFCGVHLRKDGSIWVYYEGAEAYESEEDIYITGERCADSFVRGALAAGADPVKAVELAIVSCVWIGGPVQVETI